MRGSNILRRAVAGNPLPEGTMSVGSGLVILGAAAFVFLALAYRAIGAEEFASLSALWTLTFIIAPGIFLPLEQEMARAIAERLTRGQGAGPLIRRALLAGCGMAVAIAAMTLLISGPILRELFDGDDVLLAAFVLCLLGFAAAHATRGVLSGHRRYGAFGVLLGTEGLVRVFVAVTLFAIGVETAGPYGLLIGGVPLAAVALALSRQHGLMADGPPAPWRELSSALGYLLAGSLLAQLLANAAPMLVKVWAEDDELAGHFMAAVILSRIPLFLFQALQAALLPKLTRLATSGMHHDFRGALERLLLAVAALGAVGTLIAATVGPPVIRLLDPEFSLGARDLGLLAAGNGAYLLAITAAQALIALSGHARAAFSWACGAMAFAFVLVAGAQLELLVRVELALLTGGVAVAAVTTALVHMSLRQAIGGNVLVDAASPVVEI